MRVLSVCRFDTGFRGDFWCEDMIFDWRIRVLVGRFEIVFGNRFSRLVLSTL